MKKLIQSIAVVLLFTLVSIQTNGQGYKVGDKARDFKLKNVDEKIISLESYSDAKGFIVVFTCNHCPFAKAYESRIIDLDKKYATVGYPVIAINPNDVEKVPEDSFDQMQERAKSMNYTFPYLYDESQEIAKAYGATRTPHVYILQKQGKDLIVKYIGAIDDNADEPANVKINYVKDAINALLSNKSVAVAETKAIGCTIKWKE